ncbi:programmed cell death protein 2 [Diachasma alloeum]|uniref:programmed cell death protein 2 n=1 Tax=Diachasma alloeum TaxID=454923 RepID=UPI0007381E85|nr:programmed cell death protein 2 [Diachasma alloeum]
MGEVDIGFVEECERWRLQSRFFPSKVGGEPAWLDLKNVPGAKDVECGACGDPCVFLCQVYAPYFANDATFHRTIFVFVCKKSECCKENYGGNLKVLREQLSRKNEFYPFDAPEEREDWRPDLTVDKWTKTCHVCGLSAPSKCAKCREVSYCSKSHQVIDWKTGHKEICNDPSKKPEDSPHKFLFPELELITESENSEDSEDDEVDEMEKEKREMEKYKLMVKSGKAGTLQSEKEVDGVKMAEDEDEVFTEFRSRVDKHPDQVLRYDRGGSPLYISAHNQPENIPKCEECGGDRQFEFQIMPQLLNYLGSSDVVKDLDWGVMSIFTCKNSCIPKSGYCSEFIWKQDIVGSKKALSKTNT